MNPEIVNNHSLTSHSAVRFIDYSVTQGRCLKRLNLLDDSLPSFLRNYPYPLHSWPWFIASTLRSRLHACVCRIPALIYKAVRAEFAGETQRFATFYNMPQILAEIFMESGLDMSQLMVRADAVLTSRGLKILEVNAGPDIGGWQIQWFDKHYRNQPALAPFFEANDCRSRNIPLEYMKHLIEQGRTCGGDDHGRINVLLVSDEPSLSDDFHPAFQPVFHEALRECGANGEIMFETNFEKVDFNHTGAYIRGRRVASIASFNRENGTQIQLPRELYRSFLSGRVYWPGNPFVFVIGDKRSLAIVNSHRDTTLFDDEERRLIETHVPWSATIARQTVQFDGTTSDLEQLLLERREDFVIKAARGGQGKDVYVGRFQSAEAWRDIVRRALSEGAWLAQEYCASLPFYGQSGEEGCAEHDVIWGAFGFGARYGGCWLRLMLREAGNGVINSAMGATETIVYEVDE